MPPPVVDQGMLVSVGYPDRRAVRRGIHGRATTIRATPVHMIIRTPTATTRTTQGPTTRPNGESISCLPDSLWVLVDGEMRAR
jgi:hypothetical protein